MIRRRRQNKDDNNQNIWKEILEELRSMNQNLTQKLDTMSENITKQLIQVNKKLGQIIKITKLHRAELSEYSLFMLFKDDYIEYHREQNKNKNIKILKAEIEDIGGSEDKLRDFVIEVGNGEVRKIYIEAKTAITEKTIGKVLEKFENVEGEKWVLARWCDSKAIESFISQGINVYTYDDESKGMKMYFASDKTGKTGKTGQK
ncbi:MAG: hypothetical protein ABIL50_05675 [candidate division WOR-3 bacterium]